MYTRGTREGKQKELNTGCGCLLGDFIKHLGKLEPVLDWVLSENRASFVTLDNCFFFFDS